MALCIPITKYRQVKKLRDDAVQKVEDVTKEFDAQKETTEEYKTKYEDLMKQMESTKSMGVGGISDELDGGKVLLDEDGYKEEASKTTSWPAEMTVKDLAIMSIEYLHTGQISKDFKGSRTSLKGTLSIKPLEITVVNLSKKTTLQIASSYFKAGRFSSQPDGAIEAGESHTYGISSKDGRAKTGVKGGLSFIVCDVPEPMANGDVEMDEEPVDDVDNGNKKKTKEEKKKEKQEKKELKRQEKKSKKEAKKKARKGENTEENVDAKENEEGEMGEDQANGDVEEKAESEEVNAEENEGGDQDENMKEEEQSPTKEPSIHEDHHDEDDELPEGNGDFLVLAFENPLAGLPKAKCSKTNSKDIQPLVKQLKNDKPSKQALFGHYKGGKRHFVFVWKDEELEW